MAQKYNMKKILGNITFSNIQCCQP